MDDKRLSGLFYLFVGEEEGACFKGEADGGVGFYCYSYCDHFMGVGGYFGDFEFFFLGQVEEVIVAFDFLESNFFDGDPGMFDSESFLFLGDDLL